MKERWAEHYALVELWIGILLCGAATELILLFFERRAYHSLGLLIGMLGSLLLMAYMERTISQALDAGEKGAQGAQWKGYLIRYFGAAALLAAVALTDIASPVVTFFGLWLAKPAAYLQPLTHRISEAVCGKTVFEREPVPEELQYPEEFAPDAEAACK